MTKTRSTCAHCGRSFLPPPTAEGKRFCCDEHRYAWHNGERQRELAGLRAERKERSLKELEALVEGKGPRP